MIKLKCGTFERKAWTGGSPDPSWFARTTIGEELIEFFFNEQINECGGMDNIKNCLFGDQTVEEKLAIFRNRALLDAWATYR